MHDKLSDLPHLSATDYYRLIRGQIEHEDNLLTQRLSWFLASQAFLFSAFAIVLNSPVQSRFGGREPAVFFWLLPIIAIAVGVLIWLGVWAGILAMKRLRGLVSHRADLAEFPPVQGRWPTRGMGLAAPMLLPPMFIMVWVILLIVG
jgi:hypothetical protein